MKCRILCKTDYHTGSERQNGSTCTGRSPRDRRARWELPGTCSLLAWWLHVSCEAQVVHGCQVGGAYYPRTSFWRKNMNGEGGPWPWRAEARLRPMWGLGIHGPAAAQEEGENYEQQRTGPHGLAVQSRKLSPAPLARTARGRGGWQRQYANN